MRQLANRVLPGSIARFVVIINHEIALSYSLELEAGSCISAAYPGRASFKPETKLLHDGREITIPTSNVRILDANGGKDMP